MKKFDNHVYKLQKEMNDITNNLNKFRNKNHKTISLIINNLNVLANEITDDNNLEYNTIISSKNSQNENQKNSIDIYNEKKNYNYSSMPKKSEINYIKRRNSFLSENKNKNYKEYFINKNNNCSNKINGNFSHTPRNQYYKINNIKYNPSNDNFYDFINNELKNSKNGQALNKFYSSNKKKKLNNNNIIKKVEKIGDRNTNNLIMKNENKYLRTELENKKNNNTITNLLFNNKKDFIYFNRNKQNYYKQNANNINKAQTFYYTHRDKEHKSQKSKGKKNNSNEINLMKNINDNDSQENYKNNSINESSDNNINNNLEYKKSKNNENEENIEVNQLLKMLTLNNINDLKETLKELYNMKVFTNKVISLFYKKNKNIRKNEIDLNDILRWISSLSKNKKENDEYKLYCKKLMKENNINDFNELKSFIDKILNKNIQNNNFIGGVKKILSSNIENNSDFNFIDNINY